MNHKRDATHLSKRKSYMRRRFSIALIRKVDAIDADRYLTKHLIPILQRMKARGVDLKAEFAKRGAMATVEFIDKHEDKI